MDTRTQQATADFSRGSSLFATVNYLLLIIRSLSGCIPPGPGGAGGPGGRGGPPAGGAPFAGGPGLPVDRGGPPR